MTDSSGTSSFYQSDGDGNVTAIVNANQLIVGKYSYDPFGATLSISGPKAFTNPYGFSSKPIQEMSGHYDFLYRWHAPGLQRWLNRDPIEEDGGLNVYAYVGKDPVNARDSLGLIPMPAKLEWNHDYPQDFRLIFENVYHIDIDAKEHGTMLPRLIHRGKGASLHNLGYNANWRAFLFEADGKTLRSHTQAEVVAFRQTLRNNSKYNAIFAQGTEATSRFYPWRPRGIGARGLARAGRILALFGLAVSSATAAETGQRMVCQMQMFNEDIKNGQDDWALVNALDMRHEMNSRGAFAGDFLMREMYGWK